MSNLCSSCFFESVLRKALAGRTNHRFLPAPRGELSASAVGQLLSGHCFRHLELRESVVAIVRVIDHMVIVWSMTVA
jgi:hypothetical protein